MPRRSGEDRCAAMMETGPLFGKLSPGPGMSPRQVASHQRARIHSATIVLVAERGYNAATVRDLAQLAGVSTRAFYEHFSGKEECFLRTYELAVRRTAKRVAESQGGERDWLERLRRAFEAFAAEIEREPQVARVVLVEVLAAGTPALRRMRSVEGIFEAMIGGVLHMRSRPGRHAAAGAPGNRFRHRPRGPRPTACRPRGGVARPGRRSDGVGAQLPLEADRDTRSARQPAGGPARRRRMCDRRRTEGVGGPHRRSGADPLGDFEAHRRRRLRGPDRAPHPNGGGGVAQGFRRTLRRRRRLPARSA